jgi:hypothetical protein
VIVGFKTVPDSYQANAKLIKWLGKNQIMLYSINTKYEPQIYHLSEIANIFKLVRIIRDVK